MDLPVEPLSELVGRAEFVGLGEATHTSGGLMEARVALTEWLVEHDGFRLVAVESPWRFAAEVGDRVELGVPVGKEGLTQLSPLLRDRSTVDLLDFLATWNRDHPDDPVRFVGIDVQQTLGDNRPPRPDLSFDVRSLLPCRAVAHLPSWPPLLEAGDDPVACHSALVPLEGATGWDGAVAISVGAAERMAEAVHGAPFSTARDQGMEAMLLDLRNTVAPGARTVIWDHDLHVAKFTSLVLDGGDVGSLHSAWESLGERLAARFGDGYVAIAVTALDVQVADPEYALTHLDRRRSVERAVREDPVPTWVDFHDERFGGEWWLGGQRLEPGAQFDAALVLPRSRPAD